MDVSKSRIFEIQVFVFDCWQILTKWMFENLRLFKSKFSCLTVGGNQKVRLIKVGGKKSAMSKTCVFSICPLLTPNLVQLG